MSLLHDKHLGLGFEKKKQHSMLALCKTKNAVSGS